MFTSVDRRVRTYLIISAVCLVFGGVYEVFSHGVISGFMVFAFLIPLLAGALVSLLLSGIRKDLAPAGLMLQVYDSGVMTLTVGSIVHGILVIYGTASSLEAVYWIAGGLMMAVSVCGYLIWVSGQSMRDEPVTRYDK